VLHGTKKWEQGLGRPGAAGEGKMYRKRKRGSLPSTVAAQQRCCDNQGKHGDGYMKLGYLGRDQDREGRRAVAIVASRSAVRCCWQTGSSGKGVTRQRRGSETEEK
jgi:hypothetical protein